MVAVVAPNTGSVIQRVGIAGSIRAFPYLADRTGTKTFSGCLVLLLVAWDGGYFYNFV